MLRDDGKLPDELWRHPAYFGREIRILRDFYRRHQPALASPERLHTVMRSFVLKAERSIGKEHWADMMFESIEKKYGIDPRDDEESSIDGGGGTGSRKGDSSDFLHFGHDIVEDFATARFGASTSDFENATAVLAEPILADTELHNAESVRGNLVVIKRGAVSFATKARRAQAAGASGVVFVNTDE